MIVVALYRARTVIVRSAIVVLALVVLLAAGISSTVDHLRQSGVSRDITAHSIFLPVSLVFAGSGFVGLIIASIVCGNLSRERSTLALAWTRPQPRVQQALTLIAIDLVTILIVDVIAFAGAMIVVEWFVGVAASAGTSTTFLVGDELSRVLFAIFGASFMWYGVVAAVSAPFGMPLLAALSWPAFITIGALAGTHALSNVGLDSLVQALAWIDPLTYVHAITTHPHESLSAAIAASYQTQRSMIAYGFAAAGIAVAAFGWSRKEYSR